MTDQPPYRFRMSVKAKHVRLVITPQGLEVVVPVGFDLGQLPEILQRRQTWIERAIAKTTSRQQFLQAQWTTLPTELDLKAIGQTWQIEYVPTSSPLLRLQERTV